MNNWKHTLNFKYFYHNDELSIQQKGELVEKEIQKVLKSKLDYEDMYTFDMCLSDIADTFLSITGWEDEVSGDVTETEEFDIRMSELYDWCDDNRVWVVTR